jgi:ABC-type Fe3+/spermidine/putrescine transport system ATPase subunit
MNEESRPMLVLREIYKAFGSVKALKGVSSEVGKGELVTFLGPSGCGKTTLLRCIGGLAKPDAGDVILDGEMINDLPPDKRGTQMCFQNYALFPHMTVAENISYGPQVHKWKKKRIRERVEELLHLVLLEGMGDRPIDKLSGGQQQRVALARALALEPKILLLDEPLSNLDANLRVLMRASLREIQKRVNITTIFVTHDQFEAMSISDRLVVMHDGIVEQIGTPGEIYEKPSSEFVASFIGYVNILNGVVRNLGSETEPMIVSSELGDLQVLRGEEDIEVNQRVFLIIRPETIRMGPYGEATGINEFKSTVITSMYGGSTIKYTVDIQGKNVVIDQFDPSNVGIFGIREKVTVAIPQNVHILKK